MGNTNASLTYDSFSEAVKSGNINFLKRVLKDNIVDINETNDEDTFPLYQALSRVKRADDKYIRIAQLLSDHQAFSVIQINKTLADLCFYGFKSLDALRFITAQPLCDVNYIGTCGKSLLCDLIMKIQEERDQYAKAAQLLLSHQDIKVTNELWYLLDYGLNSFEIFCILLNDPSRDVNVVIQNESLLCKALKQITLNDDRFVRASKLLLSCQNISVYKDWKLLLSKSETYKTLRQEVKNIIAFGKCDLHALYNNTNTPLLDILRSKALTEIYKEYVKQYLIQTSFNVNNVYIREETLFSTLWGERCVSSCHFLLDINEFDVNQSAKDGCSILLSVLKCLQYKISLFYIVMMSISVCPNFRIVTKPSQYIKITAAFIQRFGFHTRILTLQ